VVAIDEMLDVTLAGGRDAPARARFALGGLNGSLAGIREPMRLLVTELVTNAVKYAPAGIDGIIRLTIESFPGKVRVEVIDEGDGFEAPARATPGVGGGYGLVLLERLANRWGVTVGEVTRVWFEIDRPAAAGAAVGVLPPTGPGS
jgi:signal transduction histidine kinase